MIDWNEFETDVVQLEPGVPKQLSLTHWRQVSWFEMPGLRFDVTKEDGQVVSKVFATTSKRLIRALKSILTKAEAAKQPVVHITIQRVGEGLNTNYQVQEEACARP